MSEAQDVLISWINYNTKIEFLFNNESRERCSKLTPEIQSKLLDFLTTNYFFEEEETEDINVIDIRRW